MFRTVAILKIERHPCNQPVFNLAVDEDESYIADGIVVHNCRSQLVAVPIGGSVIDEKEFLTATKAGKAKELSGKGFGVAAKGITNPTKIIERRPLTKTTIPISTKPLFTKEALTSIEKNDIESWSVNSTLVREALLGDPIDIRTRKTAFNLNDMFKNKYAPDGDIKQEIFRGLSFNMNSSRQKKGFTKFNGLKVGKELKLNKTFMGFTYDTKIAEGFSETNNTGINSIILQVRNRQSRGFNIFDKGISTDSEKEVIMPNVKMKVVDIIKRIIPDGSKKITIILDEVIK